MGKLLYFFTWNSEAPALGDPLDFAHSAHPIAAPLTAILWTSESTFHTYTIYWGLWEITVVDHLPINSCHNSEKLSINNKSCMTQRMFAPCGAGASLFPPCPFTSSSFPPFYFSLSFIGFTYFLLLSIPSLSTRIVPLRFQAGGRRRRPNLGLVCVLLCNLCYLYSFVKMDCGALFYLV